MEQRFRLKRSSDFERVRRQGESFPHPLVVLITLKTGLDNSRIGIAAGRSVGKAVQRNRAKRLLRAAISPYKENISCGYDLVLIARRPILEKKLPDVQKTIVKLLMRSRILKLNE